MSVVVAGDNFGQVQRAIAG